MAGYRYSSFIVLFLLFIASVSSSCGLIPLKRYHKVSTSDTPTKIAEQYQVSLADLLKANRIKNKDARLKPNTKVYLPYDLKKYYLTNSRYYEKQKALDLVAGPETDNRGTGKFYWPVNGYISSRFGKRGSKYHSGIDIVAKKGTPVRAASSGVVVYSDDRIKGYGNMIVIKHKDGFHTVYAHNDKNIVDVADKVKRGEKIASVGETGKVTGPHLHFEVRKNKKSHNPMKYLDKNLKLRKKANLL